MLVLSRKAKQRLTFPNLGIAVEILRVSGNAVKVGVDAPDDVRVLRGELPGAEECDDAREAARRRRHDLRNRLHSANLALRVLQKQLDTGKFEAAERTLDSALRSFTELDRTVAGNDSAPATLQPIDQGAAEDTAPRALVVEDNDQERELLAGYLRLCGFQVESVEDGLAAVTYLAKHQRPDVVLLDMQMPRMDGIKTISAIRRNPKHRGIKLFAVSGSERNALNVPLGERGVDRWFTKPLKPDEFAHQLNAEIGDAAA